MISLFFILELEGDAQRFALPALGRGRRSRPIGKMIRRVKLLEIAAESPASGACFVSPLPIEEYSNDTSKNYSSSPSIATLSMKSSTALIASKPLLIISTNFVTS